MTPPDPAAIERATASLVALGALELETQLETEVETLTPLGRSLSRLPIDPRLGKALIVSHALGCLKAVALVAAWLTAPRDPFGGASNGGDNGGVVATIAEVKRSMDSQSDHAAFIRANIEWNKGKGKGKGKGKREVIGIGAHILPAAMMDIERSASRLEQVSLTTLSVIAWGIQT